MSFSPSIRPKSISAFRWCLVALFVAIAGIVRGESAQYSFNGSLQGELPLEVEFLSLARKHGLDVSAIVGGTLSVSSRKTVFDPVGTSSVELKLMVGQIQELNAFFQGETLYRGLSGLPGAGAQITFGSQNISVKEPNAFPARIGLPSPTGQDTAFVLEGISLQLDPAILGQLHMGVEEPEGTLNGKIILKKKGGKNDGEVAELDFSVTNFQKKPTSLWDSQEWRSVATVMDQLSSGGLEIDDVPVFDQDQLDDNGDLIVIPEPTAFGLLAGVIGGLFILLQRRRRIA